MRTDELWLNNDLTYLELRPKDYAKSAQPEILLFKKRVYIHEIITVNKDLLINTYTI